MSPQQINLQEQTIHDISDDFELLTYLSEDLAGKIARSRSRLKKIQNHIHPSSIGQTDAMLRFVETEIQKNRQMIQKMHTRWANTHNTGSSIEIAIADTGKVFEGIRTLAHATGAIITASDFQSPSFDASGYTQSGRQNGTITATQNDYKRDQHEDAYRYEQAFLKEYIDAPIKYQIHMHATHTGMAAFTSILGFLLGEGHIKTSVLIGTGVYFEVKQILKAVLGDMVHEVDETDMIAIEKALRQWNPDAVFFDGISNSQSMPVADIDSIISLIERSIRKETYVVIDNTTTSLFIQPFRHFEKPGTKIRLICFESLNKFHQFGMDTVFGGIIASRGGDTINLFNYRRSMGTNISDSASLTLPTPNRTLLLKRLRRIERNAATLALNLSHACATNPCISIDHIVYPGLPNHPQHAAIPGFSGPFLTLAYKHGKDTIPVITKTAKRIMNEAKKEGIPLISGTSFGLAITRVYQTATKATETVPFLRISPGTETAWAFQALTNTLIKAVISIT